MKIDFTYSPQYDAIYNNGFEIPSFDTIVKKKKILEDFWAKNSQIVTLTLRQILGLDFRKKEIVCYLNHNTSLSDPLSLKLYKDMNNTCDTLIHELIHVILTQNQIGKTNGWKKLNRDYKHETPLTVVHIAVHAVHQLVYEKLMPERVAKIQTFSEIPAYVRSWEIVKEIGSQHVVSQYILPTSK